MVMMIPKHSYFFHSIRVTLYLFFLVSFVIQTLASPAVLHCRHDQRDALLEFKHEFLVNESHSTPFNWNKSNDCCSWDGIGCDAKYGVMISLYLRNVSLNNTLKPNSGLFKLKYLQHLTLATCSLNGKIPSSLGNLSRLTYLVLSDNEFVGQVPASVRNLTQLSELRLSNNNLSGQLPVSFFNLTELTELHLDYNYFKSELIADMSRLPNLEYFSMSGNSLFGHIPERIFKCLSLLGLDLSNNDFIGAIPGSISQLVNLSYLDLSNNKLEGKVPSFLWRLEVLDLSQNSFSNIGKSSDVVGRAQMRVLRLNSKWPWLVYIVGAMSCLTCSSVSQLFACHSKRFNLFFWRLDYAGISVMIVASFFAPIYYAFSCHPYFSLLYLSSISFPISCFQESYPNLLFPPVPKIGDFDLKEVLKSQYFFN